MAKSGLNLRDLPQLLTPDSALILRNYLLTSEGGLTKRKGLEELFDDAGTVGITMLEKWTDDIYIYSFGTTVKAFELSTETKTTIKSNFVNTDFDGARYGDYFFVASSGDKINRISRTLDYNAQTSNFTVGDILTGGTSGATATILEDADAGVTGTLTLGNIQGIFQNNETITDPTGGSADADGTVGFTITEITAAPKARVLTAIDTRLFAGNLEGDEQALQYSEVDDGTNPPFDSWPQSTLSTDGGTVRYKGAGAINDIVNLAKNIIVFGDEGKWAFTIDIIDSGGTLVKIENSVMYRIDAGGKKALQTKEGVFYVNSQGLWQLVSVGQDNIEFSDQEQLTSVLLGNTFFNDIEFDNASLVKDDVTNTLLIALDNDSTENNSVLTYNTELRAFGTITGWSINRFLKDGKKIYGGGSLTAKVWQVLEGNDDDGVDIFSEFYQELGVGALWTRKELQGQYIQGELSQSTCLNIRFDIFDRSGKFISDKLILKWVANLGLQTVDEYGSASWGASPWGGDVDSANTIESFNGAHERIKNFQRIRVRITENSKVPHTINWFSILTREKVPIRVRQLTNIT